MLLGYAAVEKNKPQKRRHRVIMIKDEVMDAGLDPSTIDALLDAARSAAKRAYAPYSHFPVGAAALLPDGRIVTGCNVENASYPLSICAERVAAVKVAEMGERTIAAIAVTAP